MSQQVCLLTPTWAGDRQHFELLRASVERSALKSLRHHIVVQTEDMDVFRQYAGSGVDLVSTADILPAEVEKRRRKARQYGARFGRDMTRIMGSLARRIKWPGWVHYTGWHVQQISKLALAAASDIDNVVVLDSDVVVTHHARADDFLDARRIVCFEHKGPAHLADRKVRNWNRQAQKLFGGHLPAGSEIDIYFDTPFVFHAPLVRSMMSWLEMHHKQTWWKVLLRQPPRRWSEFATYRTYLRLFADQQHIDWRSDRVMRYLFDANDPQTVRSRFLQLLQDTDSHYVTIHSQSSGRQLWGADEYVPLLLPLLHEI